MEAHGCLNFSSTRSRALYLTHNDNTNNNDEDATTIFEAQPLLRARMSSHAGLGIFKSWNKVVRDWVSRIGRFGSFRAMAFCSF